MDVAGHCSYHDYHGPLSDRHSGIKRTPVWVGADDHFDAESRYETCFGKRKDLS